MKNKELKKIKESGCDFTSEMTQKVIINKQEVEKIREESNKELRRFLGI